jgi:hypothetical protein
VVDSVALQHGEAAHQEVLFQKTLQHGAEVELQRTGPTKIMSINQWPDSYGELTCPGCVEPYANPTVTTSS